MWVIDNNEKRLVVSCMSDAGNNDSLIELSSHDDRWCICTKYYIEKYDSTLQAPSFEPITHGPVTITTA